MTRDDILALSAHRARFNGRYGKIAAGGALVILALVAVILLFPLKDGVGFVKTGLGLGAMGLGGLVTAAGRLLEARRPNRYTGGALSVGRNRPVLLAAIIGGLLYAVGMGLITWSMADQGQTGIVIFAAFGLLFAPISLGLAVRRLLSRAPVAVISEEGLFLPALMGRAVRWDEIDSLPIIPGRGMALLAIKSHDPADNRRSVLSRPIGDVSTYVMTSQGLDATQADVLLAIAHFQPRLTEALDAPANLGTYRPPVARTRTISPA